MHDSRRDNHAEHPAADAADDRFALWQIASTLTSGMLASPSRQHYSVKDSIALYDDVLTELAAFARLRGEFTDYAPAMRPLTTRQVAEPTDIDPATAATPTTPPATPFRQPASGSRSKSAQPRKPAPAGSEFAATTPPPLPPTPFSPGDLGA